MLRHFTLIALCLSLFSLRAARADFEVETLAQAALQTYTEDHSKTVRKSSSKDEFMWNDRALKSSDFSNIVLRRFMGELPQGMNRYQVLQTDQNGKVVTHVSNDLLVKILKENGIYFDGIAILKENGKELANHRGIYKFKDRYYEIGKGFNPSTKKEFSGWSWIEYQPGLGEKSESELKKEGYFTSTLTNTALLKWIGLLQPGASASSIEGKVTVPYESNGTTFEYLLDQSSLTPKRVIIDPDRLLYKYNPRQIISRMKVRDVSSKVNTEKKVPRLDLSKIDFPSMEDNIIILGTPGNFSAFYPEDFDDDKLLDIEKPEIQIRQKIRQFPSDKTFYVLLSPKSDFLSPSIKEAIAKHQDLSKFAYDDVHYDEREKLFQNVRCEFEGVEKGYVVMRIDPAR